MWHECFTRRTTSFNLKNNQYLFSFTLNSLWRKINVVKILKLWENCCFIFNFNHILKFKNFRVWHGSNGKTVWEKRTIGRGQCAEEQEHDAANSTTALGGYLEAGTGRATARCSLVHRSLLRRVMPRRTEREKEGKEKVSNIRIKSNKLNLNSNSKKPLNQTDSYATWSWQ